MKKLEALNPLVQVNVLEVALDDITAKELEQQDIVCVTDGTLQQHVGLHIGTELGLGAPGPHDLSSSFSP